MKARSLTLAAVLLLVILGVTFATLYRQSQQAVYDRQRDRRQAELTHAAQEVAERLRKAEGLTKLLAGADSIRSLASEALDPEERLAAFRSLDALLSRLRRDPLVRGLSVRRGLLPLAGYGDGIGAPPSPLEELRPPPIAVQAEDAAPGATVFDLAPGSEVLLAATRTPGGLLLIVALDAHEALATCARAASLGTWALVAPSEQVLSPESVEAPPAPPAITRELTLVDGDDILVAVRIGESSWQLRARVPVGDHASGGMPLALSLLAAFLVVYLGLRGARTVALQHSLQESERQERQLQAIFDAINDILVVVDPELRVIRSNRIARERHGKDLEGRPYAEAILLARTDDPADELAALRAIFSSGEPRQTELEHKGRVWQVAQYPIFAPDLTVRGVVEYGQDVTQTRSLQSQLVQSEKLSTLGEMAAGIAHEINNPIGVVSMFAQLLEEEIREQLGADSPALEKVTMIEEQATNVGEIVRGLLRFTRKSEGTKAPYQVQAALERALTIVEHQKLLSGIELVRDVPEHPLRVLGDEGQLAQLILNLVVNACHAMAGEGQLRIALRSRGPEDPPPPGRPFGQPDETPRRVDISISDTGKGIAPEDLERIFEPFFTTKPAGQGTGLGLSVGFGIIRDHGGCIWVASEPGAGTTFTLDLPELADEPTEC